MQYVLGQGPVSLLRLLGANLLALLSRPLRYLGALAYALRLSARTPSLIPRYLVYFAEAAVAGKYLKDEGVTLFHTHFSSTVALFVSRIYGLAFSMTVHGPDEFVDVRGFHMKEKVQQASAVVAISNFASSQIKRAALPEHWSKVCVIPLGVDPLQFQHPRVPAQPEDADMFRLVTVGRLAPAKAQIVLIEAMGELARRGKRVKLTVVGDGPDRALLDARIKESGLERIVHLVGSCNHDQVVHALAGSDAFVLSSFAEGVPVVLMEAMAMGLPCVSTWITGIPELMVNEQQGLLVPPDSSDAIADAVCRLMTDREFAQRIGAAGREKVRAAYDLSRNTERLASRFVQLLPSLV